jgi:two-component system, NarL family, response regulator, fimbrial Z protein, FimZ
MIKVCLADNYPIVHYGMKSYFNANKEISIVANIADFDSTKAALKANQIDVLVIDLDLNGMASVFDLKKLIGEYPNMKVLIYSNLAENMYAANCIKLGASGYLHKTEKLETLSKSIIKVYNGEVILNDEIRKNMAILGSQLKKDRLHRKLSNREIEVLRYLCDGKKNNEIATILGLNEKTISTYKLRLLLKLNVTNLLDLVNKAKTLATV